MAHVWGLLVEPTSLGYIGEYNSAPWSAHTKKVHFEGTEAHKYVWLVQVKCDIFAEEFAQVFDTNGAW